MFSLERLSMEFCDSDFIRYTPNGYFPNFDEESCIRTKELLELGRNYPRREHLMIGTFEDGNTRVIYAGEDVRSMRETVEALKLPKSWPTNIGEKVFYLFRGELKKIETGSVCLEQEVTPGDEHQFRHVIKNLLNVYRV